MSLALTFISAQENMHTGANNRVNNVTGGHNNGHTDDTV